VTAGGQWLLPSRKPTSLGSGGGCSNAGVIEL